MRFKVQQKMQWKHYTDDWKCLNSFCLVLFYISKQSSRLFTWLPKEDSFIFSCLTSQVKLLIIATWSYHPSPPAWRAPCPSHPRSEQAAHQGDRKYTRSFCSGLTPAVPEWWEEGGSLLQKGAAWIKCKLSENLGDVPLSNYGITFLPSVCRCPPALLSHPASQCLWLPSPSSFWSLHVSRARQTHSEHQPILPGAEKQKFKHSDTFNKSGSTRSL